MAEFRAGDGERAVADAEQLVRTNLARELHDRVAQTLTAMIMEMENFKLLEVDLERGAVLDQVSAYQNSTREALSNIRAILYDLRGDEELGLEFTGRVRRLLVAFEEKTGIAATLTVGAEWPARIATAAAVNLYRVLEEALNNVRLHSDARAVAVSFDLAEDAVGVVSVRDDGIGIRPSLGERVGLGIVGMRERVLLLGGDIRVERSEPQGTHVIAVIPKERLV
ncbi:MAG: histidine kinase [Candidatus Dormibacteraeota bacterium]|nr:histidine kinase [Candidatus Dormibacteraeota bacterium]